MRVLCSVAALLLLALSAQAKPSTELSTKVTSPEINEYIDRVVQEVKKLIIEAGIEPMTLPDLIREFFYTDLLGITWHGEASLKDGMLMGLLTLFRDGDADMDYGDFILHVGGALAFSELQMNYDFTAVIMGLGPEGTAICTVKGASMAFEYDMDISTLRSNITSFAIASNGNINCQIRGLGAGLNFLAEIFVNLFIDVFQDTVLVLLSNTIQTLLQTALDNIGGFNPPPALAQVPYQPPAPYPVPYMRP